MKFSKSRQRRGGQPFDDKDLDFGFKMGKNPSNLDMISDTAEPLGLPSDFSSKYPKTNRYPEDSRFFPTILEKSTPLLEDELPGHNPMSRSRSRSRARSRALSRTRSRSGGNRRKKRRKTKRNRRR